MAVQTSYSEFQAQGYSGMPATPDENEYIVGKNVESTAQIPAGVGVKYKTSSPGSDLDMLLPAASSDKIVGIVARKQNVELSWTDSDGVVHGQFGATGFLVNALMTVATKGKLLVTCATACAPGDPLFVRADAGEASEQLGSLENAADESDMIDCTAAGIWRSTATAGKLAWLDFDFHGEMA